MSPSMRHMPQIEGLTLAERIEQSPTHELNDPRSSSPEHSVRPGPLPVEVPERPRSLPPGLRLVGGTDVTPELLAQHARRRS
jgi:hypothetical protein